MANINVLDGAGASKYMSATGAGTNVDPYIPVHAINGTVTTTISSGTVTANLGTLNGAATAAKQPALGTAGTASSDVITVQGIASMTPLLVNGSGVTQPISAAALPLPSGAATAAKQPALGTAGTASSDVITVQGITSMTALNNNQTQIAGNTISTGNGVVGTGVQRVAIASDNTAFSVNSTDTGNVAHDGVDSGNPVKIGFKAYSTNPTAVASADRTDGIADLAGRQIIRLNSPRNLVGSQTTTITASTSETTIVTAAGSGVFADLTHLSITNSSATGTVVTLKDATAGTTRGSWYIAPFGGICLSYNTPKVQNTANNNWTLTCGTSVSSISVVAEFVNVTA